MKQNLSTVAQRRPSLIVWLLMLAGIFGSIAYSRPLSAQEKSFLWKVSKEGKSIYLLGSIHYLKKENFPLRKPILDALASSKRLVLEIDLNNTPPGAAQRVTLEKAVYHDGSTLEQNVEPDVFQLASRRATELGIDPQVLKPMKPWFVALTMMAIKFQQLGLDANVGVDRYLAERAKASGKPTSGLETLEFQLTLLDQLPKRDQEMMLRETVTELDLLDKNIDQIVQSWLKGESASLEALLMAGMKEYPDLHQKIILDRNRRWLPQIEQIIGQGGGAMVVVGAAHLVGKDGVVEMLKNHGYELEQQ
jgi:uncharacterized protein